MLSEGLYLISLKQVESEVERLFIIHSCFKELLFGFIVAVDGALWSGATLGILADIFFLFPRDVNTTNSVTKAGIPIIIDGTIHPVDPRSFELATSALADLFRLPLLVTSELSLCDFPDER